MRDRIGFIGAGAMGSTLLKGLLAGGFQPEKLYVADADKRRLEEFAVNYGVRVEDNAGVARQTEAVFLAVKPQDMGEALDGIREYITPRHLLVSVAAGISTAFIEERIGIQCPVVRVMPNTPCLVREGAMVVSGGNYATQDDVDMVMRWLSPLGQVHAAPEKLMDAVTGLSGSGPAYVYLFIEALADGGVLAGLPRPLAAKLAAQTVLGAARMVMESGQHPALLREQVTSPGGTTAAGLLELEDGKLRSALIKAVKAAAERSKELGG